MKPQASPHSRVPKWAVAFAVVAAAMPLYAVGQQLAEPAASEPVATEAAAAPVAVGDSPAAQLARGDEQLAKMKAAALGIRNQLERVRREGDSIRTVCLDDKLSQANVAVRTASDRRTSLAAAAERGDREAAASQSAMMQVLAERSDLIVAEANSCVGATKDNAPIDDRAVRVDDGIANAERGGNPLADQPLGGYLVDPPQCASCWR